MTAVKAEAEVHLRTVGSLLLTVDFWLIVRRGAQTEFSHCKQDFSMISKKLSPIATEEAPAKHSVSKRASMVSKTHPKQLCAKTNCKR